MMWYIEHQRCLVTIKKTFQDTINKYVPTYAKRKKELVYHSWSVYFEKEEKQTVEKVYCLTHSTSDLSNFKSANNELRCLPRSLRKKYEQHLVQNVSCKPKVFWQYISSRFKMRPSISELLSPSGFAFWNGNSFQWLYFSFFLLLRTLSLFQQLTPLLLHLLLI